MRAALRLTCAAAAGRAAPRRPPVPTIFDKILSGDIPSNAVWDDDIAYAFRDIQPQAPQRDGLTGLSRCS
eukprot:gene29388-63658_t